MLGAAKRALKSILKPALHRPDMRCCYEFLGTEYGGWPVVDGAMTTDSIVYSFGVGRDISFDLALIAKFGCNVWAFDPTPKSREWVERQMLPEHFHFRPIGIAAKDGEMRFFPPANENYVSYSAAPGEDQKREPVTAPVRRLATIASAMGHSSIDVLKMDVEGFEYDVIDDLLVGNLRPKHVLVEFHHGLYRIKPARTRRAVTCLREAGYGLFYVSVTGREYGFFRRP